MQVRQAVTQGIVLAVGLLTGFFFVLNFLFSDGPPSPLHPERLVTYLMVLAGTLLPALLGARFGGGGSVRRWALLAGAPGLVIALLFLGGALVGGELGLAVLPALYALCVIAGAWGGSWLGTVWLARRVAD